MGCRPGTGGPSGARRGAQDVGKEEGGVGGHSALLCGSWLLGSSWGEYFPWLGAATMTRAAQRLVLMASPW